jgi:hypothetical protein
MRNTRALREFFYKKNIFFGRKIPRVEPGRASIHGTSVPGMEGGIRTIKNKDLVWE